jgi:ERCC4-type nuclease
MYRELDNYLTTLELKAGMRWRRTTNKVETAQAVVDLYRWWTHKDWEQHRSHLAFNTSRDFAAFRKPPLVARMAKELELVGWDRAHKVAQAFDTPAAMALADVKEWQAVDGIGKKMATKIVAALRGGQ